MSHSVLGSHTYATDGSSKLTVTINNTIGISTVGTSTVVAGGPASHLAVTSAPVNATLGGTFTLVVTAEDAAGHVDPNASPQVSLQLTGTTAASLGGVTIVNSIHGVATLPGLSLSRVGLGYSIAVSTTSSLTGTTLTIGVTQPVDDFVGNGTTQPAIFRRTSVNLAQWYVKGAASLNGHAFGAGNLDVPFSGDYDGDGKADLLLYRPSMAQWFLAGSASGYHSVLFATFGSVNGDIPVPGNYNGSGTDVLAVYRPATGQWFIRGVSGSITFTRSQPGDLPVPGDYDNIGMDEPAIYRPSTGQWIIDAPTGGHTILFGGPNDIPVPGSYDATATNHAVEPAVWRPSTGQFFIHGPGGNRSIKFAVGDIPAPGDYSGIGVTEIAVYSPGTSQWYVLPPTDSKPALFATFGGPADIPVNAPYRYRALKLIN
jgi:hypothetical protein